LILYSTENPETGVTEGKVNEAIQVATGIEIIGAAGKITALLAPLCAHAAGATVLAAMVPQAAAVTYLVRIV
jgi:hypothetical protein